MSSYVQRVLLPDERVMAAAHLHWIIYVQGMAITTFGGLLGFYAPAITSIAFGYGGDRFAHPLAMIAGGFVLIGAVLLSGAYLRQSSTELVVTNRRVIAKYGFISRNTYELMINRITGTNFDQTVLGRILGFGTIIVHGAGGDISPFDNMADPRSFQNNLMAALERAQGPAVRANLDGR